MTGLACFKAYDLRGRVPEELDETLAYRVGRAFGQQYRPQRVALGRDIRTTSAALQDALAHGLIAEGAQVIDLGLCGTEEVYWAAQQQGMDGGIMVTASHNPIDYNGMKLVLAGALPVSGDSGLPALEARVMVMTATPPAGPPEMLRHSYRHSYVEHLLGYVHRDALRPLRIVVNAGNGGAGALIDALAPHLPFEFIRIHHEPDGNFPNGIPNPLLPENRHVTTAAVQRHAADLGVAWDGDFDRCFLFDEQGQYVESYYLVGLLAERLLQRDPGAVIVHDPRLLWATVETVEAAGGVARQCKTGHAFIKEFMRRENALYGGEMSAHHYFRDFGYCDNGQIPWLLVAALISESGRSLSHHLGPVIARFPVSGEINLRVHDVAATLADVEAYYRRDALRIDHCDGVSMEFATWRFNLRGSNTEPLIRLNVETRGDADLLDVCTRTLINRISVQ
jgi:phosphomannomutase